MAGEGTGRRPVWRDAQITVGFLACAALLASLAEGGGVAGYLLPIYLLAVLGLSLTTSHWGYGVAGALVGAFAIDLVHTPPRLFLSFSTDSVVALLILLAAALPTGLLIVRLKGQATAALEGEKRAGALAKIALEREKRAESLAQGETTRAALLRSISHDLRTPLTGIMGASATLLEGREMQEAAKSRLLVDIRKSAQWLLRMVENILTLTRLSTETVRPRKGAQSAEEALSQAVSIVRARFPNCRISVRLPDQPLLAPIDLTLVSQVLINLLENAVRYSPEGEPVLVTLSRAGDFAQFEVTDSGRGIPPQMLDRLFSPQKQPDQNEDKLAGAGVGLSICQTIVEAHGGVIQGQNREEGGARFTFQLPLEEETQPLAVES